MRMRWLSLLVALLLAVTLGPAPGRATSGPADRPRSSAPPTPVLVAVRAAHRDGVDHVVFEFRGGLPESRQVGYVRRLFADGSGRRVRVAGRALLRVRFEPAQAHTDDGSPTAAPRRVAYALPNVMTAVRAGDFEAVTTYGLGLARRTPVRVTTLQAPPRVVVEVGAGFATVRRKVWFLDRDRFADGREPYFVPVRRPVVPGAPATGLMDRLFAGPLPGERARGLRLLRSGATGYDDLTVAGGVADLRLTGRCRSGGATVSIAGEVLPTLKQLPTVDRVVLRDAAGSTLDPDGPGDSTPACLEP
uniref:GerMN domain-containing protein n=1 Tax=Nocardioides xinjiangensis TaxID=2817376 RepID=UPI001B304000|nr:GerMN domain-containing protein [Nocardioides sp. SYSU D00514]